MFLSTFLFILAYNGCFSSNVSYFVMDGPDSDDPKEILYRELSADAYFNLPCHESDDTALPTRRLGMATHDVYKHKILSDLEFKFETQFSQPADQPPMEVVDTDRYNWMQYTKNKNTLHDDAYIIRKGIHRYYGLRALYTNHLPFEIGYITQVIMAKYQNVLELYEFATKMEGPENKIGRPHLFFFYKNILEDCRNIIHLCNMMHEVVRKYKVQQRTDFNDRTWIDKEENEKNKFESGVGNEGWEHERFRHEKNPDIMKAVDVVKQLAPNEAKRLHDKYKRNRQFFLDNGHFTMTSTPVTRRTKRWRSKGHLDYGWAPPGGF